MPRFFAARTLNLGDREVRMGDEVPEAADWRNLDAWIDRGAIVISITPEEIVETLRLSGGSPEWLRRQSARLFRDVSSAIESGTLDPAQAEATGLAHERAAEGPQAAAEAPSAPKAQDEVETPQEAEEPPYDPGAHKVAEVLEWAKQPERTEDDIVAAIEAEEAGSGRTTLIQGLMELLDTEE